MSGLSRRSARCSRTSCATTSSADVVSRSSTIGRPQRSEVDLLQPPRLVSASATPVGDKERSVLLTLHDLTRVRQLDVTRREFVTNVSHELPQSLASMKASVETLEGGAVAEPRTAREFLQRIHREVDRMTYLVNDLLDLSRLESGHAPLNFSPVDLRPLVDEAVESVRDQAEGRGVSIGITMPAGLPMVLGEREMLGRVFVNLLDNALRASTAGGSVRVSAAVENGSVDVRVADRGIGIPPEHLPHIFERFYKVDRSRRDGGTGLGLAIVKHIVQVHGGDVSAESREGPARLSPSPSPGRLSSYLNSPFPSHHFSLVATWDCSSGLQNSISSQVKS